jgi:transposase
MAKAYSDDLRGKLLEAYDRGEGSLRALAERFGVSVSWAWKISRQRRRTGQMERVEQRHGPRSRITAAVQMSLRRRVRQQPDATLVELQQRDVLQLSKWLGGDVKESRNGNPTRDLQMAAD